MILDEIKNFTKNFLQEIEGEKIYLVSHFDTDGITSAAIFIKTLEKLSKQFSVKILKSLTKEDIEKFPEDKTIVLLDLGSSHLNELSKLKNKIFVIDHHEIKNQIPSLNIRIINPHLINTTERLCAAELSYLVSREISEENKELAYLAVIGRIGDVMESEIGKTTSLIIEDSKVHIKEGLLIYPSTRPIDKALEYSSRPFIPGVTGDSKGTFELLKEAGIEKIGKSYKSLIDLDKKEMKDLVTAVMLRLSEKEKNQDYIGNLFLIKFFNKIEDAREISAIINAGSRMGQPTNSLMYCLGHHKARANAEKLYVKYRQHIISGLKQIEQHKKIQGREYVIINVKDKIKDTLIGTLASILSFSSIYKEGTVIIGMAYNEDKIKISTRMAGRNPKSNRNLKKLMESITEIIGGESGGHQKAAGCIIRREDEDKFIDLIKNKLDIEIVKV
ncbi:MAG: DHH family phosphoesterase [Candidatus Pacearchaeota archaeon]|jgi:RecJ-like exonuclease